MADNNWIQEMVGRVVSQALENQLPALRDELVRRVLDELPADQGGGNSSPKQLLQAISGIRQAGGQKEILGALLDGASRFSSRTALFVVRGASLVGWQGRGFANSDAVKNFTLNTSAGLGAQVLREKAPLRSTAENMDGQFTSTFSAPRDNRVFLLPLLLKEKVAAVLYADAGADGEGQLDDAALEMLVLSGGLWLEIVALRRATAAQESTEPAVAPPEKSEAAAAVSTSSVPAQAESPDVEQVAEAAVEPAVAEAQAEPVTAEAQIEAPPMAMAAAAAVGGVAAPFQVAGADDDAIHRKAKRFAKLLVDEIKLYNKAKVQEGKANCDLYDRLKEDIEKSRAAYEKRYGNTAAGSARYFDQEIIGNLADNDRSLLGDGFSR